MAFSTNSRRQPPNPLAFNPGSARTAITIQTQTAGTDASGASVVWSGFATGIYAEVKGLRGADAWKAGQFTSEKYLQVRMRYLPGVLANMRITFSDQSGKTRTLQIVDPVNVLERGVILEILCLELDGQ